jgi:hypothetical protein
MPIHFCLNAVVDGVENVLGIQSPFCVRPVTQCLGSKIPVKRTSILTPKKVLLVESLELSQAVAKVGDFLRSEIDGCLDQKKDIVVDQINLKVSPVKEDSEGPESQQSSSVDSATSFHSRTSGSSILQSYRPRSKATLVSSQEKKNKDSFSDDGFSPAMFAATCLDFTAEEFKRENKATDARYNFKFLTYEKPISEVQSTTAVDNVYHSNRSILETNKSLATPHQASSITWTSFSSPLSAAVPVPASAFTCTPIFRDSDPEESTSFSPGIIPFSPDQKSARNEEPQEMSCTIFSPISPYSPASTVETMDPSMAQNDDTSVLIQNENLLQDFYPNEISFFCGEVSDSAKKRLEEKALESPLKLQSRLYRVDEKLFRENENSEYENISDLQKSVISQKSHQNGEKELFGIFDEDLDAELSMLWESATDDLLSETHSERDEHEDEDGASEIETAEQKKTMSYVFSRFLLAIILTVLVYLTASVSVEICTWPAQKSQFTNFDHREFLQIREDFLFSDQTVIPESFYSSFPDLFISEDSTFEKNSFNIETISTLSTDEAGINMGNESSESLANPENKDENENEYVEIEEHVETVDHLTVIDEDSGPSVATQIGELEILSEQNGDDTATWMEGAAAESEMRVSLIYSDSAVIGVETDLSENGEWYGEDNTDTVIFSEPEYIENTADSVPSESIAELTVMSEDSSSLAGVEGDEEMQSSSSSSTEVSVFLFNLNSNALEVPSEEEIDESEEGEGEGEAITLEVKEGIAEDGMEVVSDPISIESLEIIVDESVTEAVSATVEHTDTEDPLKDENPLYTKDENSVIIQNTVVVPAMSEEKDEAVLEYENVQSSASESIVQGDQAITEIESVKTIPQLVPEKSPRSPRFAVTPHGLFIGTWIFSIFSFFVILYFVVINREMTRSVLQEYNSHIVDRDSLSLEVQDIPKNKNGPLDVEIAVVEVAANIGVGIGMGMAMAEVQFEEKEREIKKERKVKDRSSIQASVRVTRNAAKNFPELLLEEPSSTPIRRMSTRQKK